MTRTSGPPVAEITMEQYRELITLDCSEDTLKSCVIDLAHSKGWKVAHFRPALTSKGWRTPVEADGAGFPDLVLARIHLPKGNVDLLIVELKAEKGKLSNEQSEWLATLPESVVRIWRPSNWMNGEIEKELS